MSEKNIRRIQSTISKKWHAFSVPLPPVSERPNPDTVASLDRWTLFMPGPSPAWNYYCVLGVCLRDFPGVKPAHKKSPEMTHEIIVAAMDPDFPQENIDKGGISLLDPLNYVHQFVAPSDEMANKVLEAVTRGFLEGQLVIEPQGVSGARELFADFVKKSLDNLATEELHKDF